MYCIYPTLSLLSLHFNNFHLGKRLEDLNEELYYANRSLTESTLEKDELKQKKDMLSGLLNNLIQINERERLHHIRGILGEEKERCGRTGLFVCNCV